MQPEDAIKTADDALKLFDQHAWVPFAAVIVGFLVRLMKTEIGEKLFGWISPKWRTLVAILLGQLAAVLERVKEGVRWRDAIFGGLAASAIAVLGHDLLIEGVRGGKEVFDFKKKT